ncbi:MAG: Lactate utilization protein B [Parabacteroides sp.]
MSTKHAKAAARFIADRQQEAWHDETLWMVRVKRDRMSRTLPEWERLRQLACDIKLYSNSHLETLLQEFEKQALANGAIVHWAKDAEEHNGIVHQILREHDAHTLIKSKSMLTEECHMNAYLQSQGYEVVESDLGERILQLMHLAPSHIVMPAIHIKREAVGKMMEQEMGTEKGNSDPTYLTHEVRKNMREKFLHADVAMTGVNFAVASTGEIVVCTNEGNADMGTSFPKVHIAVMGMEKIVPDLEALGVFTRLLARSGTGQPITSYTSHYRKPKEGGEFHIIIVDNGRSNILSRPDHIRTLNCIRCGECMDTCPVYRRSGGYSYTYFIPGPIGINLSMLKDPVKYSDNVSACSLCLSCSDVCPVKIDLGEQIYRWRQDLDKVGKASTEKKLMSGGMKFLMERPALFNTALKFAPLVNKMPRFMIYNCLNAWGKGREMPAFAKESFNEMWKNKKL